MKVLVTRPAAQAAEWVAQLVAAGIAAEALPLIGIAGAADAGAVAAAWQALERQALVVFVSPNAVEQFFAARPPDTSWPAAVRAASPGPGTSAALRAHGVAAARIVEPAADAPQFDSEALWARLDHDDWHGAAVTIVRGDGGRDWLAGTLRARGATVLHVAAYRRVAPALDAEASACLEQALAEPAQHLWFFSSSEAVEHLVGLDPATRRRAASALATHPRIAATAREAGFARVHDCRPTPAAVIACIQSIARR
jgi:uroporphyrinogen-III synthase